MRGRHRQPAGTALRCPPGSPSGANIGPGAICTQVWNGESEKIKVMMEFNGEPSFRGRTRAIKATN